MSYPATRRFFRDDEFRNENAAISGLVRALAGWQNHTWARDLTITPADAKVYSGVAAPWPWAASGFINTPDRDVSAGRPSVLLAVFPVPDPRAPCTKVTVEVNAELPGAGTLHGELVVTNVTTGAVGTCTLSWIFGAAGNRWFSTEVTASVGDVIQVSATYTAGATFTVSSLSAWWSPSSVSLPGVTFTAGWFALSQTYCANDRALSTYLLRQLGRTANALVYDRPQPIACSWLYNPAAGVAANYNTVPLVVGRYKVPIGARVTDINIRLRYRISGACSVTCALSGGGSVSIPLTVTPYGTASGSITRAAGAFSVEELTLTVAGSPNYCDIEHVLVYEAASDLALPGGESVPSNYDPNLDERIVSGRAIRKDDIARLVANMAVIWKNRRHRVLVNDCRYSYKENDTWAITGVGGVADVAAMHDLPVGGVGTGFDFTQVRVRQGWHGFQMGGTPDYVPLKVGSAGTGDYAGCTAVGVAVNVSPLVHGQAAWQHRWGTTPTPPTVLEFETRLIQPGSNNPKSTRPTWTVLEQLPHNSPHATYP